MTANNNLMTCIRENKTAINGWLVHPCSVSAELMAKQGYDAITIDMQHGMIGFDCALTMLQAIATTTATPIVRVPWLEPGIIMKMLDAGAQGIICPMIETVEQTEAFVAHCFYPPVGNRSFGPTRAMIHGGSDYPTNAQQTLLPLVMIETRKALDNLDAILATPGLGGVYIGPFDLSYALGCEPKPDDFASEVMEAVDHILARAKHHNVFAAIHGIRHPFADRMRSKGFNMVTAGCDGEFIRAGAAEIIQALKPKA